MAAPGGLGLLFALILARCGPCVALPRDVKGGDTLEVLDGILTHGGEDTSRSSSSSSSSSSAAAEIDSGTNATRKRMLLPTDTKPQLEGEDPKAKIESDIIISTNDHKMGFITGSQTNDSATCPHPLFGQNPSPSIAQHLKAVRRLMKEHNLDVYIVQTADEHQSEEIRECDRRREFISNFDGSAATCAITEKEAFLFTDGRYWTQAVQQISSDWQMQKCEMTNWLYTFSLPRSITTSSSTSSSTSSRKGQSNGSGTVARSSLKKEAIDRNDKANAQGSSISSKDTPKITNSKGGAAEMKIEHVDTSSKASITPLPLSSKHQHSSSSSSNSSSPTSKGEATEQKTSSRGNNDKNNSSNNTSQSDGQRNGTDNKDSSPVPENHHHHHHHHRRRHHGRDTADSEIEEGDTRALSSPPAPLRIGYDASTTSIAEFLSWSMVLGNGTQLVGSTSTHQGNLIDRVWKLNGTRPPCTEYAIRPHNVCFAGASVVYKIEAVRRKMRENGAQSIVVAKLDELAWLYNLRGGDMPYSPTFWGYGVVGKDFARLYVRVHQLAPEAHDMLSKAGVEIVDSDTIPRERIAWLRDHAAPIWMDPESCNMHIYKMLDAPEKALLLGSPILELQEVKNAAEINGTKAAYLLDATALARFMSKMEADVASGAAVTEYSAATMLDGLRAQLPNFYEISFPTISAADSNAAMVHYVAKKNSSRRITPESLYLVDSGGQYSCGGTSDITRTMHFGSPSQELKNNFTLVLKAHIKVAKAKLRPDATLADLDTIARVFLLEHDITFDHGLSHGIGSFLNVHEGNGTSAMRPGMVLSNEPGYYVEGKYGIRIENTVLVVPDEQKCAGCMKLETISLAPIQRKLIEKSLLDEADIAWINNYHERIRTSVAPYFTKSSNHSAHRRNTDSGEGTTSRSEQDEKSTRSAYDWLVRNTQPL